MTRSLVTLRSARPEDAGFLAEIWGPALRRGEHHEHVSDLEQVIREATAAPDQRLVVAEYDGHLAGAVLLRIGPVTPLNLEPAVRLISPHVAPAFRRHGVGRTLMECGVAFAEENGVAQVVTGVESGSRDANRFMARLALGPLATLRMAPTSAVRARLTAQRPALATSSSGRQLTRVMAARRSMRRAQTPSTTPG